MTTITAWPASLIGLSLAAVLAAPAMAETQPFYHYALSSASSGTPGTQPSFAFVDNQGAGAVQTEAGSDFVCHVPGCSITFTPGQSAAFTTAYTEAATGQMRMLAGAMKTDGEVGAYDGELLGKPIHVVPSDWGWALSYAYQRSEWRVVAEPGSGLAPGEPVRLSASVDVQGWLDGDDAAAQGALLFNRRALTPWLDSVDFINSLGSAGESAAMAGAALLPLTTGTGVSPWRFDTTLGTFVGDTVVLETLFQVSVALPNDGQGMTQWARFDQSLYSTLAAETLGVALQPVPEPAGWMLMALGLFGLARATRRAR